MAICFRLYWCENVEFFEETSVYMVYPCVAEGKIFNWFDLIAQQLHKSVTKVKNISQGEQLKSYMSAYSLGGIRAKNEFLGLEWKWTKEQPLSHVYCKI